VEGLLEPEGRQQVFLRHYDADWSVSSGDVVPVVGDGLPWDPGDG
jgi:hypothetical protein